MRVVRTSAALRAALAPARGRILGFVPTMGALHAGHVALLTRARGECDMVAASIFVNPKQFDDPADLAAYPRTESDDVSAAAEAGVDVLFAPDAGEVFRDGHATSVHVQGAALGLEGDHRPGHFDGVALVCLKLFGLTRPTFVYFGQKDAQQVAVIRQIVRDLDLDLEVRVVPTVRDADGLALSSRNARLSVADRDRALAVPRALCAGLAAHQQGQDAGGAARAALGEAGLDVDYADVAAFQEGATLVVAVRIGTTRLIDNVPLDRPDLAGLSGTRGARPRSTS